uniref:Variant surface glycoprotein 1125.1041 n=1 Tax=Trypanosoma brucei TaxID=5691 RepID=A0A1J0R670_9TRYP|nr:variant surface glycoprotein 1125.1041 [Trypanosoma brucei]
MATKQIAIMFLLAVAPFRLADSATLNANENAKYFSSLCSMIKLATTKLPTLQDIPDTDEFAAVAELVNLSYTAPEALKQIPEKTKANENIDTENTQANKYCKDAKSATCKTLAELLGEQTKNTHTKTIFRALAGQSNKKQVDQTAAARLNLLDQLKKSDAADKLKSAESDINSALEGVADGHASDADLKGVTDRATTCGNPNSGGTPGEKAGSSLALDALCVCGQDTTQSTGSACGFNIASGAQGTDAGKQWANTRKYCEEAGTEAKLTGAAIRASVAAFKTALNSAQLASNYFPGGVGTIDSSPTNGCTGVKSSNDGCCVFYGKPSNTIDGAAIPWVQKLLSASSNLDAAEQKQQSDLHIFSQIQALNVTLTALIIAPETTHNAETPGGGVSTESQKTKPMEEKKKECEQHQNNKTACTDANCKLQGKADADGPCVVDETKVKTQTNAAPGTGDEAAGSEAAETGCAAHKDQTTCKNDKKDGKQNCTWRKGKDNDPEP